MSTPALSVTDLVKTFDLGFLGALPGFGGLASRLQIKGIAQRVQAVHGVTFDVRRGEIFGFLGPNGAGKTTTIKMLMGLLKPTSGTGTLLGHPLGHRAARERLGFLPEHPYFYDYLKPMEFLDFYGRLFPMTAKERRRRSEALIERLGLSHAVGRPLRKFSKGMVQRIGIAQALINDPELIVLDEPMSGLDPIGRKDIRDLIFELREQGKTIFFSSHILQDVEMICDRVAIIIGGEVRALGPLAELLQAPTQQVDVVIGRLPEEAAQRLEPLAESTMRLGDAIQFRLGDGADVDAFVGNALGAGGRLVSVVPHRRSLEDLFVAEALRGATK
jgi:ABC-2 type transport system ATP-binding protein